MVGSIELILALLAASPVSPPKAGYCVDCHARSDEKRLSIPTASIAASVHASLEDRCIACHGGDAREPTLRAHEPSRGFRGKPGARDIPLVCGGCHSDAAFMRRYSASLAIDQLALYRVSEHGKALARGEEDVATCVSCHGSHGIRRISDAKSSVHPLHVAETCGRCHGDPQHRASTFSRKSPVIEWKKSVHAKALLGGDSSAPTCNDCHGDHGAAPPGTSDIHRACGSCHAEQSERFENSPHKDPYGRLGFGECAECHGRHDVLPASDAMLDPRTGVCRRCHAEDEAGQRRANEIRERIGKAVVAGDEVHERIARAKRTGLFIPDAEAEERELITSLRKLRIALHTLELAALEPEIAAVDVSRDRIVDEIDEAEAGLAFERRGYGIFILLVLVMAALLWLKLRRLST
jgi:predicted CXXCH cytochrome family protein